MSTNWNRAGPKFYGWLQRNKRNIFCGRAVNQPGQVLRAEVFPALRRSRSTKLMSNYHALKLSLSNDEEDQKISLLLIQINIL
jgi:hypothetical protein